MKNFLNSILDLIYRKRCYFCGSSKYSLKMCPKCFDNLEYCSFLPNRIVNSVNIYCAGMYNKELQKLIRGLKYHNQKELAYYQAKFMYDYFKQISSFADSDFELVAVPLHKNRIKKRKYNHMELVCEEFSKLSGFQCNFNLIKRVKDTKPQYKLNRKERLINLHKAFEVEKEAYNGKRLLIMDDICTTGATFEEMINELNQAGIKNIICFATATPV